jgi:YidC/Oxa1 family membrane protein insertase
MRKRRILILLLVIGALFTLTGCTIPKDPETGKFVYITAETTFNSIMQTENWFTAIFVFPLANLINIMVSKGINVGVAITALTLLVHSVILALTWKSNVQQAKLQEIQPELTKIQNKYKGLKDEQSRMKQAQDMQNLYKKNEVNPLSTMLSTFVQFPVIIAMYQAVQRAEAVATGSFFGLSLEQTPLAGIKGGEYGYVILFALMIVAQFGGMRIPTYLTERRGRKEALRKHVKYEKPKNAMQNQMYIMILFISVLAISWPAAMSLYWMISSVVNVLKQIIIHKMISKD